MGRSFGPAVEKAMPVMLKVAFGSIGVLFVTALVLIYSDKRFGDGWGHAEAMAFMIQRATVILIQKWSVLPLHKITQDYDAFLSETINLNTFDFLG